MPEAVRRNIGVGEPPDRREQLIADVLEDLVRLHGKGAASARSPSSWRRLGLGAPVQMALGGVFERWDGFGVPRGFHLPGLELHTPPPSTRRAIDLNFPY